MLEIVRYSTPSEALQNTEAKSFFVLYTMLPNEFSTDEYQLFVFVLFTIS